MKKPFFTVAFLGVATIPSVSLAQDTYVVLYPDVRVITYEYDNSMAYLEDETAAQCGVDQDFGSFCSVRFQDDPGFFESVSLCIAEVGEGLRNVNGRLTDRANLFVCAAVQSNGEATLRVSPGRLPSSSSMVAVYIRRESSETQQIIGFADPSESVCLNCQD